MWLWHIICVSIKYGFIKYIFKSFLNSQSWSTVRFQHKRHTSSQVRATMISLRFKHQSYIKQAGRADTALDTKQNTDSEDFLNLTFTPPVWYLCPFSILFTCSQLGTFITETHFRSCFIKCVSELHVFFFLEILLQTISGFN